MRRRTLGSTSSRRMVRLHRRLTLVKAIETLRSDGILHPVQSKPPLSPPSADERPAARAAWLRSTDAKDI